MTLNSYHPAGVCRFCACTEANPCRLREGDECAWYTRDRNVCTNPKCTGRYEKEQERRRNPPRPRKRTTAEVHAQIMEERRKQAKRYREAAKLRGLIREKGGAK